MGQSTAPDIVYIIHKMEKKVNHDTIRYINPSRPTAQNGNSLSIPSLYGKLSGNAAIIFKCQGGPFASTVGTEELGHLEMIGTIVHQLTRNLTEKQIKEAGFDAYFIDHTTGVYPTAASGFPWSAGSMQVTGDTIADLTEDLAAEQKARVTYDNILRLSDDPDVSDAIRFLRAREIVHFQRFGEAKRTR